MAKLKVGVLASGGGTDLQSIIDATEKGMINAEVVVVVSDNKEAFALYRNIGFRVVRIWEGYYSDTREDAIIMAKRL